MCVFVFVCVVEVYFSAETARSVCVSLVSLHSAAFRTFSPCNIKTVGLHILMNYCAHVARLYTLFTLFDLHINSFRPGAALFH